MALVFALYLLLCVRVTADIRAGLADGRIQFAASVGVLMLEARIDGSVEGAKVRLNIPIRGFPEKPDGKKIRQSWPTARAVLKAADWELIALHMRAGLEDAGATAMFAGGIRAAADGMQRYPRHGGFCRARRLGGGAVHSFHAGWRYYACGGEGGREKEAKRGVAMEKHPIESLMGVSMEQIKDMVDVNTVIGDAVQTQDGSTIIPISRVSFGFVAGGGEYAVSGAQVGAYGLPFAGGAGAGVSIHPMGFLVCGRNGVRLLSAGSASPMERVAELIPQALENWKRLGDEQENAKPSPVRAAYQE